MRLLIPQLGQTKRSGGIRHLKILQGMSGVVHDVDVHHGFDVIASRGGQHYGREARENHMSSSFHPAILLWNRQQGATCEAVTCSRYFPALLFFHEAGAQDHAVPAIVQFDGENQHIPLPVL